MKSASISEAGAFQVGHIPPIVKQNSKSAGFARRWIKRNQHRQRLFPFNLDHSQGKSFFAQFCVVGDRCKYLVALMNIAGDIASDMASEKNITAGKPRDLAGNKEFKKLLDEIVAERNSRLGKFETIKYYRILKDDFTGELTTTLKMRRKTVLEKYNALIAGLYKEY